MPIIDYEKLERRRIDQVPAGSKVKIPNDESGRMFTVGGIDRFGMHSLHRGKDNRIEVSMQPSCIAIIHEEAEK